MSARDREPEASIGMIRELKWKAQDEDDTEDRWIADAFVFFYHVHSKWLGPPTRGSTYTVWVTPWAVPDLNRWETAGHRSLGEFANFEAATLAAASHLETALAGVGIN